MWLCYHYQETNLKHMKQINFTKEANDFTDNLGSLTPDKYDYAPQVGDIIEISESIFGEDIVGRISLVENLPKEIIKMLEENDGYLDGFNKKEEKFLNDHYYFWGDRWSSIISDRSVECWVFFEKNIKITSQNINKIKADVKELALQIKDPLVREMKFSSNNIEFNLYREDKNNFKIVGKVLCLVNGHSIKTTKEIEELKAEYQASDEVENVAWSDGLIDIELKNELNKIVDKMCQQEKKDYHPGSKNTVRDIVHPSLYCYVDGVSQVKDSPLSNFNEKSKKKYEYNEVDFWGRKYEDSKYQWLPSEFFVDENGKVSINSYINNLDKEKYPEAYYCIAKIFGQFIPALEMVCSNLKNDFYGDDSVDDKKVVGKVIPLRNIKIQVVTKIVEYCVNEEENFDGVWHVEGMSHENILATGLYIFKRDENFDGADIDFRRFLYPNEGNELIYSTPQNAQRQTDQMGGGDVKPLGRLETPEGRAIVFPNSHIHKLSNMTSKDGKDAKRRILVFWVVNPDCPIVSTANVEPQQSVMSFKDAKKYQLELMKERKVHKEDYSQREVYLCEH